MIHMPTLMRTAANARDTSGEMEVARKAASGLPITHMHSSSVEVKDKAELRPCGRSRSATAHRARSMEPNGAYRPSRGLRAKSTQIGARSARAAMTAMSARTQIVMMGMETRRWPWLSTRRPMIGPATAEVSATTADRAPARP